MIATQRLAACRQRVLTSTVTTQHTHGAEMSQHAIKRIRIGVHRRGQLRRAASSARHVVGNPQRCRHAHRHRRRQVRQRPQPGVLLARVCHHVLPLCLP
jgi:hypothetical protein